MTLSAAQCKKPVINSLSEVAGRAAPVVARLSSAAQRRWAIS
ncbi:hypothetical protein NWF34_12020 [Gordonia sp. GONU]|nr:hypothetical protein [Gordonia sp. GONU]